MSTALLLALPLLSQLACFSDQGVSRIPSPPIVTLGTPGDVVRQGDEPLQLLGTVADAFDQPEDLLITWELDEGRTVQGSADADGHCTWEIDLNSLSFGPHRVRLLAEDSDGDMGSDVTEFEVWGPIGAPDVLITSPDDGSMFLPGVTVTFQGEASDAATDADDLVFAWDSSIDGPFSGAISADGQSVLIADALSQGEHLVTLTVTDTEGDVGSDSIVITVGELPDDEPIDAEPGDLVFSEMMINPQVVADEVGEWVELFNTSGSPIEIAGYTFRDDDYDYWVLEGSMVVEPQSYFVLCADLNMSVNGGVPCDGWFLRDPDTPGLALANGPDEVVLMRPDGAEIDWVHYDDNWFEKGIAIGVDPSHLDGGDNDDPSHWCNQTTVMTSGGEPGTPGIVNDDC